jgi:hypothetical protein
MKIFICKYSNAICEALNSIAHCCYVDTFFMFLDIPKIAKKDRLILILQRL